MALRYAGLPIKNLPVYNNWWKRWSSGGDDAWGKCCCKVSLLSVLSAFFPPLFSLFSSFLLHVASHRSLSLQTSFLSAENDYFYSDLNYEKPAAAVKSTIFFALLSTNPILIDQNVQLIIPSLSTFWLVCMVCGSQPDAHRFPWEIDRGILKLPTLYFKCVEEFPRDITFSPHDIINEIGLKWLRWSIHKLIYRKLNGH